MAVLTEAERDAFLAEPGHLLRVGTIDEDGTPRVLPVWFLYKEGSILFTPRGRSILEANLKRDLRVGMSIDEDAAPYRKATISGRARVIYEAGRDAEWREIYRAIATRYVPEEWADRYIEETADQPRPLYGLPLAEAHVSTWRMPLAGENPAGIWARRYYVPGTPAARRATERYPAND
ncbi:MAG TPA: pyridoxamine 5'-phosphate oxidase family protein [Dehalococcoidia bacterium]|nr:pyridoxamine 5'-phosphate oxidase family protein [Dehalococcoidia bacterium]